MIINTSPDLPWAAHDWDERKKWSDTKQGTQGLSKHWDRGTQQRTIKGRAGKETQVIMIRDKRKARRDFTIKHKT